MHDLPPPPTPLETALHLLRTRIAPLPVETVPPAAALGRHLAVPVFAPRDLPAADNSAMDGYALRAADAALGVPLPVVGRALAGRPFAAPLPPGAAVRITTGALIPPGCDAVVPQERVTALASPTPAPPLDDASAHAISLHAPPHPGDHIRRRGEEIGRGDLLLPAGTRLGPAAIGLLAAAGVTAVDVRRHPRISLIITGDELVTPAEAGLRPECPVDANSPLLVAALAERGLTPTAPVRVDDTPDAVAQALEAALVASDLVLTTGGASVGPTDPIAAAFAATSVETLFWRVAMKPGKPVRAGLAPSGAVVIALPGNPLAALTGFERFVLPALSALAGNAHLAPTVTLRLPLGTPRPAGAFPHFIRGDLAPPAGTEARYRLEIPRRQGSGMLRTAALSPLVGFVPAGPAAAFVGAPVEVTSTPEALAGLTLRPAPPLPPLLSVTGHSGAGKTRLLEQLIAALTARGLRVGVLKHATHDPDFDRPGKDSARHAAAGAVVNAVVGPSVAMVRETRAGPPPEPPDPFPWLERILEAGVDLVLLEGFSAAPVPRVRVEIGDAFGLSAAAETDTQPGAQPAWTVTRPAGDGAIDYPGSLVAALIDVALPPGPG